VRKKVRRTDAFLNSSLAPKDMGIVNQLMPMNLMDAAKMLYGTYVERAIRGRYVLIAAPRPAQRTRDINLYPLKAWGGSETEVATLYPVANYDAPIKLKEILAMTHAHLQHVLSPHLKPMSTGSCYLCACHVMFDDVKAMDKNVSSLRKSRNANTIMFCRTSISFASSALARILCPSTTKSWC